MALLLKSNAHRLLNHSVRFFFLCIGLCASSELNFKGDALLLAFQWRPGLESCMVNLLFLLNKQNPKDFSEASGSTR
ncbi:unnamed protein product [Calypogeia fissa]